jgi:endo-1,4-beta-xylanase
MHIDLSGYPMNDNFSANLARFTSLKGGTFEVQITEIDIRIPVPSSQSELDAQANLYKRILAACLSNTNVTAFISWGVSDAHSWISSVFPGFGEGLMFDTNYNKKPAYYSILSALKGQ